MLANLERFWPPTSLVSLLALLTKMVVPPATTAVPTLPVMAGAGTGVALTVGLALASAGDTGAAAPLVPQACSSSASKQITRQAAIEARRGELIVVAYSFSVAGKGY
jgi:hypothetical protein